MRIALGCLLLAMACGGRESGTARGETAEVRPPLDAVLHIRLNKKLGISFRFDLPGTKAQSFYSSEYRYAVLDKDGVEVEGNALMTNGAAYHTVSLSADKRIADDYSEFMLVDGNLKRGEEYYVVVSIRNLTGLAKFKAP